VGNSSKREHEEYTWLFASVGLRLWRGRRTLMAAIDSVLLPQPYGGQYIARRDGEVSASAETDKALSDQLDGMSIE
jgi:hypothetical protein